jgi:hypothetical protein
MSSFPGGDRVLAIAGVSSMARYTTSRMFDQFEFDFNAAVGVNDNLAIWTPRDIWCG